MLRGARLEIELVIARHRGRPALAFSEGQRVTEAILLSHARSRHAREFHRAVVQGFLLHGARGKVEAEAVQRDLSVAALHVARLTPDLAHPADVVDDPVALVPGIHPVKYVTGLDLEPHHVGIRSRARHDADAGAIVVTPLERHGSSHRGLEVEDYGQVHE